jgi:hypothetical protein
MHWTYRHKVSAWLYISHQWRRDAPPGCIDVIADYNNDGFLSVGEYATAQGIEKRYFDDTLADAGELLDPPSRQLHDRDHAQCWLPVLHEASEPLPHIVCLCLHAPKPSDTNGDGFLSFEDFLSSYARDRPVILSMLVMAAHTAAYWVIFNAPIDLLFKVGALEWYKDWPVFQQYESVPVHCVQSGMCQGMRNTYWRVLAGCAGGSSADTASHYHQPCYQGVADWQRIARPSPRRNGSQWRIVSITDRTYTASANASMTTLSAAVMPSHRTTRAQPNPESLVPSQSGCLSVPVGRSICSGFGDGEDVTITNLQALVLLHVPRTSRLDMHGLEWARANRAVLHPHNCILAGQQNPTQQHMSLCAAFAMALHDMKPRSARHHRTSQTPKGNPKIVRSWQRGTGRDRTRRHRLLATHAGYGRVLTYISPCTSPARLAPAVPGGCTAAGCRGTSGCPQSRPPARRAPSTARAH